MGLICNTCVPINYYLFLAFLHKLLIFPFFYELPVLYITPPRIIYLIHVAIFLGPVSRFFILYVYSDKWCRVGQPYVFLYVKFIFYPSNNVSFSLVGQMKAFTSTTVSNHYIWNRATSSKYNPTAILHTSPSCGWD